MTAAVDERPAPAGDPRPPDPATSAGGPRPGAVGLVGEATLVLVTLVATASFARLFVDRAVAVPLVVAALSAHLVAALARRRGLGAGATAAATLAGFVVQTSVVLYPHTSLLGLPTLATVSETTSDLGQAWRLYAEVTAPAQVSRGFLLAVSFALWVCAGLSDWAAFRLRTTAEAVLPAIALFTFTSILGDGSHGVALAAALAAAILGFAVHQRVGRSEHRDAWVGAPRGGGTAAVIRVGLATAVVVAVLAALVGPRLPGSQGAALVDLTGGDGPSSRMTVSPLVDIRSRLVQQSEAVVFRVEADQPAYWRLTSLDRFDGQVWSSSGSFSKADGTLPSVAPGATTRPLTQTFTIESLSTIWAPAALTPVRLDDADTELRWNGELATLIVPAAQDSIDRSTYTVTSQVPQLTPDDLRARAAGPLDEELVDATRLPVDISPEVQSQARLIVERVGPSPYARALALQDWFRANFTYDLEGTGSGHDEAAIETFLRTRRGYCEQFAGTFAAMARSLGIPARVAVGFTPGEADAAGTGFTVRGRNAHAWPEVHIPGAGWVPFEPTPGRGQPGTEAYTGVAPAQDEVGTAAPATTAPAVPETTSPATPAAPPDQGDVASQGTSAPSEPSGGGGPGPAGLVLGLLLVALAAVVLDVAVLALVRARRRQRSRAATGVTDRVRAAWSDAVDALTDVGAGPARWETDREFGARVAPLLGTDGPALVDLAGLATLATWAPEGRPPDPAVADEATALSHRVARRARADRDRRQRIRTWVDPRVVLARRGRR